MHKFQEKRQKDEQGSRPRNVKVHPSNSDEMLLQKKKADEPIENPRKRLLVPKPLPAEVRDTSLSLALKKNLILFIYVSNYVSVCGYGQGVSARRGEKCQIPAELRLQAVVSHPKWVLETKLRSFSRVGHALDSRAISPPPSLVFLCLMLLSGLGQVTVL